MRWRLLLAVALAAWTAAQPGAQGRRGSASGTEASERVDYMAFAQGAVPLSIGGAGAKLGADFEAAVRVTDGDPTPFTVADRAPADTDTEFVYQLAAPTTFDRFAIPNVIETPSPTATFTRLVEVLGSSTSATDGFALLASDGDLAGTVSGSILRATGLNRRDRTPSAFILSVAADGELRGVRSTNGGPFRLYTLPPSSGARVECGEPAPPRLGCGAIIHGIAFEFDSAELRPESAAVLAELFAGLQQDASARILIEGHTSSEGADDYNRRLSERRAQAVVADLVRRGLSSPRLTASGLGEGRPIATNDNESGRALNRRVEVECM